MGEDELEEPLGLATADRTQPAGLRSAFILITFLLLDCAVAWDTLLCVVRGHCGREREQAWKFGKLKLHGALC